MLSRIEITEFNRQKVIEFTCNTHIGNLEKLFEGVAWNDHAADHGIDACYSSRETIATLRQEDAVSSRGVGIYGDVIVSDQVSCMSRRHRVTIRRSAESLKCAPSLRQSELAIELDYRRDPHTGKNSAVL